ncbi:hypothetical protein IWQ60_005649 [Tieghemiomyces parasiticus]|uniref:Uncharacterized protein n=1 Tax=Tieghemiomyces parasiticus TaxID=78921 RepID=A0A9W8AEA1_9FUNG|nr:hypothetical protein IWQ60_005649 [Tieghemiomyces parasiticus]
MPLRNRSNEPFLKLRDPDASSPADHGKDVFYVPDSGEIVSTYEEYSQRLTELRRPNWQCSVTGKTNLTYKEALESELEAEERQSGLFNEGLKELVLRYAHGKTTPVRSVIADIHNFIRNNFFEGEFIHFFPPEHKRNLKHVRIVERIFRDENRELKERYGVDCPSHYIVRYVDQNGKELPGKEEREAPADSLWRPRVDCTREQLRALIRLHSTRSASTNAPLLLKPEVREQYGIHDEDVYDYSDQQRRLSGVFDVNEQLAAKAYKRKNLAAAADGIVAKKKPKTVEGFDGLMRSPTSGRVIRPPGSNAAPPISPRKLGKKGSKANLSAAVTKGGSRAGSPAPTAAREPVPQKPQPLKFPIDDLNLLSLTSRAKPTSAQTKLDFGQRPLPAEGERGTTDGPSVELLDGWPVPCFDYIVPMRDVERLISTWSFLNVYSKPLYLSPFSLDDFEQALVHHAEDHGGEPCSLLIETFCACLSVLIDDYLAMASGKNKALVAAEPDSEAEMSDGSNTDAEPADNGDSDDNDEALPAMSDLSSTMSTGASESDRDGRRHRRDPVTSRTASQRGQPATDTTANNGAPGSASDAERRDVRSALQRVKVRLHREWPLTLIPPSRKHWEARLLGWLVASTEVPRHADPLAPVTSHLCEIYAKSPDRIGEAIERLSPAEKLRIYDQLIADAAASWGVRTYIEECHEHLSALRKERIDLNREMKRVNEERSQLLNSAKSGSEGGGGEVSGGETNATAGTTSSTPRNGTPEPLTSADLRKAARERAQQQSEHMKALRMLQDQEARNARKFDQLEKDWRRFSGFRVQPLGADRFYNTYWYLDGLGGSTTSGSGRLLVRFTTPTDPALLADDQAWATVKSFFPPNYPPLRPEWQEVLANPPSLATTATTFTTDDGSHENTPALGYHHEHQHSAEAIIQTTTDPTSLWGYYTDPDQLDHLIAWLNPKGHREVALLNQLNPIKHLVAASMRKRHQDLKAFYRSGAAEATRRVTRQPRNGGGGSGLQQQNVPPRVPYMAYRNKLVR